MHFSNIKILIIIVVFVCLNGCASGSSIVTGQVRTPIDFNRVRIYIDAPKKYETIGIVKASSDSGWTDQGSQDYAVEELKKQAAKLGANGVLLISTGQINSSVVGKHYNGNLYAIPVSAQTITGKAIYVSE